eukprot:3877859-Amphidinium_carterae.1
MQECRAKRGNLCNRNCLDAVLIESSGEGKWNRQNQSPVLCLVRLSRALIGRHAGLTRNKVLLRRHVKQRSLPPSLAIRIDALESKRKHTQKRKARVLRG